jgi:hypothetical protein
MQKLINYISQKEATQFWVESGNKELTAVRINQWQWRVEMEYKSGIHHEYILSIDKIIELVKEVLEESACPKWGYATTIAQKPNTDINRFMNGIRAKMCYPYLKTVKLSNDKEALVFAHECPLPRWEYNGKVFDTPVIWTMIRAKLDESDGWTVEYI